MRIIGKRVSIAIILCISVLCIGTGCGKQTEMPGEIQGTIVEIRTEGVLLLELDSDSMYGDTLATISAKDIDGFKVGDYISFSSVGRVLESYPLQFTEVQNIKIIK